VSQPPKHSPLIKVSDVVQHLMERHHLDVSRQTVYNWIKDGKQGTCLQTVRKAGTLYTRKEWVDAFVRGSY